MVEHIILAGKNNEVLVSTKGEFIEFKLHEINRFWTVYRSSREIPTHRFAGITFVNEEACNNDIKPMRYEMADTMIAEREKE